MVCWLRLAAYQYTGYVIPFGEPSRDSDRVRVQVETVCFSGRVIAKGTNGANRTHLHVAFVTVCVCVCVCVT